MHLNDRVKRNFFFRHFGCRLNYYEGISIVSQFLDTGWEQTKSCQHASISLIHSCTVTSRADYKVRSQIRKIKKQNPQSILFVIGCFDFKIVKEFPGVFFIANRYKSKTWQIVEDHVQKNILSFNKNLLTHKEETNRFDYYIPDSGNFSRAYVKIQDGCNEKCSYCKIPQVRGRSVSRDPFQIKEEIEELIYRGFHEIIITGINIGDYHYKTWGYHDLIHFILSISGDFYIRISSIEPGFLNDEMVDLYSDSKVARFLHVPIQSASSNILKKMNRKIYQNDLRKFIYHLRKKIPDIYTGTDILVGFPSEKENDFMETYHYVQDLDFTKVHAFPFSMRERTSVYRNIQRKDIFEVNGSIVKNRMDRLLKFSEFQDHVYTSRTSFLSYRGIIESNSNGRTSILTENYRSLEISNNHQDLRKKDMVNVLYDSFGKVFQIKKN